MSTKKTFDPLVIALIAGAVFFCTAAGLLVRVLTAPAPKIAAVPPSPTETLAESAKTRPAGGAASPSPTPPPTHTPAPSPSSTNTAAPTDTPAPAGGDKLSLPTATPTPLPPTAAPTNTPIPTNTPVPRLVEGLSVGNIAPDFTVGSNLSSRVSLSSLRGKIVILNFWTTWCPHCQREVPDLQAVHNEYGPQGVVVLAVNEGEKLEDVGRFANNNGIHFAVWLDEDEWAGNIYNVRAIPTTYFIDREGIIRAVNFGAMTREQIVAHLKNIL